MIRYVIESKDTAGTYLMNYLSVGNGVFHSSYTNSITKALFLTEEELPYYPEFLGVRREVKI